MADSRLAEPIWKSRPHVPETFDGVTTGDLPEDVSADFAPLDPPRTSLLGGSSVDPYQVDSVRAQEAFDAAVALAGEDEEAAVREFLRASKIAETAREWYLAALACQRVGDFLASSRPPYDLERAFRMYRRAVAAYEHCGLFAEARELSYRQMELKRQRARELRLPWDQRLELWLHWAIAGYGHRPQRVIFTSFVLILCFAVLYWLTDGIQKPGWEGHISFAKAIYFSGITFATVGYGDFVPAPHVRLIALVEGILGAFSLGLFAAVMANRLNRS